ncbi:hypothetical protein KPH14_006590 [Odynerus spinipes]|uniref:ENTH domain-containing protein n=1 Tax=Odynerus spinipes TaxID=1348599 RepID=A0AAD9RQU4_9HYME|nr:hypothetical protein KPH14_006590 [Odynerus spinipes]
MNMWKVREFMDKATNVVMNYTETEAKVREATNDDAWGPTGAMMQELAQATFTYEQFPDVMSMLWKRMLQENKRNWRRTYKSLLLLNYLVRNGSERVVTSSREHIYDLRSLENYTFIDEFGKDQGINIRHKVRELIDFIQDDDKLKEERKKAKKNKDKYVGLSSEAMGMRFGSGDRWTDSPKWNKPSADTYNDWDRDNRGKGFEDGNNSDDGEREDSDNDAHPSPKRGGREYRDTITNLDQIKRTIQGPTSSENASPARTTRTIKKVDLGAAANYGKEQTNTFSSPDNHQKNKNDILNDIFDSQNENNTKAAIDDDDFNPRASAHPVPSQNANLDFGDFASAFGGPTVKMKENDEFADFTSAFTSGVTSSNNPSIQSHMPQNQVPFVGATIPNVNNTMTNNLSSTMIPNTQSASIPGFKMMNSSGAQTQKNNVGNNLFDSLPSQTPGNEAVLNNNTVSSNTDLLSDLGNFNSLSLGAGDGRENNTNNSNFFNTVTSTPASTGDFVTARGREDNITSTEKHSENAANRLLETLCSMSNIKSQSSLEKLKTQISDYNEFLPGPLTHQKYANLDLDPFIDPTLHGRILEEIIDKFDHNWPLQESTLDPIIKRLIIIDGMPLAMLYETLVVLTQALKQSTDHRKIYVISIILEELIKSDAVFSGIVDACKCRQVSPIKQEELEQTWKSTIQLLVSLSNRVANKLKNKTFDIFLPETYTKVISFHITRGLSFVHDCMQKCNIKPKLIMFSILVSKLAIAMNSKNLNCLINILSTWCFEDDSKRSLIQNIMKELDRAAIEPIAVLFLKHCDIKYGVYGVFGDIIKVPNWTYTLTKKIPFMSYYEDENFIINYVVYLSRFLKDRIVIDLLIKLLDVWGDKSALTHTSIEQHKYITKLIILTMTLAKTDLKYNDKETCRKLIFSGISAHLESTHIILRAIGMRTGEICLQVIAESDDSPKLEFQYDGISTDATELIKSFDMLLERVQKLHVEQPCLDKESLCTDDIIFNSLGDKKVFELGVEFNILSMRKAMQPKESKHAIDDEEKKLLNVSYKNVEDKQLTSEQNIEEQPDLDSDDDLTPYDLSNDTKSSQKSRPAYLRDLRDNLTDERKTTNPEIFEGSLEVCEELILSQLPNDDVSFGLELLEILITLTESSYVEHFELLIFKSCVAIVTIYPKECAEYLCQQFYTETYKYSTSQRLHFLDILAESARRLSKIDVTDDVSVNKETKHTTQAPTKEISLFIDVNKSKRYDILYSDEFDDLQSTEIATINWREVVNTRIESNTKRFAHSAKRVKMSANKFGNVASSFFYPLLYGYGRQGNCLYTGLDTYSDQRDTLLVRFLKTLSTIMVAAQNCLIAPKMGKELLELTWTLRYHEQAKVRLAVIECVAAVLVAVPKEKIINELLELLMEVRLWLLNSTQNVINGEHDEDCKVLGTIGLSPITNLLTPSSINAKNPASNNMSSLQIGSTWAGSGLNIDLDNIMGGKSKQSGPAPTMNQLASNSPQHQVKPLAPTLGYTSPMIQPQTQQQQANPVFFSAFQ